MSYIKLNGITRNPRFQEGKKGYIEISSSAKDYKRFKEVTLDWIVFLLFMLI